jgi:hypothetical protein
VVESGCEYGAGCGFIELSTFLFLKQLLESLRLLHRVICRL